MKVQRTVQTQTTSFMRCRIVLANLISAKLQKGSTYLDERIAMQLEDAMLQ